VPNIQEKLEMNLTDINSWLRLLPERLAISR